MSSVCLHDNTVLVVGRNSSCPNAHRWLWFCHMHGGLRKKKGVLETLLSIQRQHGSKPRSSAHGSNTNHDSLRITARQPHILSRQLFSSRRGNISPICLQCSIQSGVDHLRAAGRCHVMSSG